MLLNRGVCLARLERLREAVEAFTRALDIDPRDVAAWHNKGLALGRLGQDDEAKYLLCPGTCAIRPAGVAGGAALTVRGSFRSGARASVLAVDGIRRQCDAFARCETRGELRAAIAAILRRYSPRDLSQIDRNFREKFRNFDRAYRDRLTEKVAEYLLGTYERDLLLAQQGAFVRITGPAPDCTLECKAIIVRECEAPEVRDPRFLFLKYLLAGFSMLVLDEPAHSVETPFPGGDRVDAGDGFYWCPVRKKSTDVDGALCPYCPARQTPEVGYLHSPRSAPEHRRRAFIDHYHDGHYSG